MTNEPAHNESGAPLQQWRTLRALSHGNYRRFFIGQGVSLLGTWMQLTALPWLVYRLTKDPFLVGLNNFASNIPWLLLLPVAGVFLDRWNLLRMVMVTQALAMVQAFILAGLVLFGAADIWQLIVLSLSLGCVNAFDLPARQAMLPELLETREDLSNAIALNSSLFNAARLVGPALAGLLSSFGSVGEGWCFLLNAVSFLAVLISLTTITVKPPLVRPEVSPFFEGLAEGLRYVWGHPPIRAVLVLVAIVGFVAMPYTVLIPIFAGDVLQGDPQTYGWLLAASGFGALIGALYLASRPNIRGSASRIVVTGLIAAASMTAFAFSQNIALSMVLMLLSGMNVMLMLVSCNTLVQTIVPDDMRGRAMSLYSMAFMGLTPFGHLIGGWIASRWDPTTAMLICATGCLAGSVWFVPYLGVVRAAIREHVRPKTIAVVIAAEGENVVAELPEEVSRV
ncbi:MAG TPA: MFS transporter [Gemmataceae bacterium]|nr:MFS transporter [Gemmataceae bacterium]